MPSGTRTRKGIAQRIPCIYHGCPRTFRTLRGRTYHVNSLHTNTHRLATSHQLSPSPNVVSDEHHPNPPSSPTSTVAGPKKIYHPFINGKSIFCVFKSRTHTNFIFQEDRVTRTGHIYLPTLLLLHVKLLRIMTGLHMKIEFNLRSPTFFFAVWKCRKEKLTTCSNSGACPS